jgi:A/G-specific adenine glycosylase
MFVAPMRAPSNALAFKRRLLRWFRRAGRDLPWRRTRDPYRVLVSEIMLQQTQVARVLDFYPRFLQRFPTLPALAKAPPARVREAWDGLGYYRRAAHLHHLARAVMAHHRGRLPSAPDALRALPGIGRYTAGAVASFAFERRAAAVDTNVARVLSRAFGHRSPRLPPARLWALAERLLPRRPAVAWEFNQALMDLGAGFCRSKRPLCADCPVRPACKTGRLVRAPHDRKSTLASSASRKRMSTEALTTAPVVDRPTPSAPC